MKKLKIILFGVFLLYSISVEGQVLLCDNKESYHPIDKEIIKIRDSLSNAGIDTIIIYRHWITTNRFNGYGKVLWKDSGLVNMLFIDYGSFIASMPHLFSQPERDTIFSFFFENKLDTIHTFYSNVQPPRVSHWSVHFVNITFNNNSRCFNINGIFVDADPENFISMLIGK